MNEADTCRTLVVPKLQAAGWKIELHSIGEQRIAEIMRRIQKLLAEGADS